MVNDRTITVSTPKDCRAIFVFKESKHLRGKGDYIRPYQDLMLEIAKDRGLNLTDLRVLMAVFGLVGFDNRLEATHTEIGELLEVNRANVSRSFHKLENKGFIALMEVKGRRKIYLLNPYMAFKTKAKDLIDLENQWDKLIAEREEAC